MLGVLDGAWCGAVRCTEKERESGGGIVVCVLRRGSRCLRSLRYVCADE
jgi:hypothetical protein